MDIIAKARQLESNIARRLDRAAKDFVRSPTDHPLELLHAIVGRVEEQIQPSGRGRRVFPFTRVAISIVAPSPDDRARFEAICESAPTLRDRIAERLAAAGCEGAPPTVTVDYVGRAHKNWAQPEFDIRFTRKSADASHVEVSALTDARIELTVTRGTADRRSYAFAAGRIHIGRGRDVRDTRHRLVRANDVAFVEGTDEINRTVSRQHAHITFDESNGEFRLHDDGSAHGTAVVRDRKTLPVPRGTRGVRLQADDEIVLGDARVRVRMVSVGSQAS